MNEKVMRKRIEDQAIEEALMGAIDDVLHDRAIANVRAMQEKQLERFRESVDQDELEVAEHHRLRKEASAIIRRATGSWNEYLRNDSGTQTTTTRHQTRRRAG
jgi:hypothetical protein